MPSIYDDFTPENDDIEAKYRNDYWADRDPFPRIPPALLGSNALLEYIRVTAMVYPFRGWRQADGRYDPELVKPASYEMRPGKAFFIFDDKTGELRPQDLSTSGASRLLRLPRNSITFVSTEETLRLPLYIAARFNLRIKHVHRGILLGTGPLIDPGYNQSILIPLHNLTDHDYFIRLDEGLIWVEFTKTYPAPKDNLWGTVVPTSLPKNKTSKTFEQYLFAASSGVPIRSSISEAVVNANEAAAKSSRRIAGFERRLNAIGVVGIIALVITVVSLLLPTLDLIHGSNESIEKVRDDVYKLRDRVQVLEWKSKSERPSNTGPVAAEPPR